MDFNRRLFLQTGLIGAASITMLGSSDFSFAQVPGALNIGFQKTGLPLVSREQRVLEKRFEPKGIPINWAEFPSGLLLLQSIDTGAVDFGNAGNVGCIFVQASGGRIVYVAAVPTGKKSEGILIKESSPIQKLADLEGKKVGFTRGSSSHNLIAAALEKAGLSIDDITAVPLSAADGALAYQNDSIDAWVVWDPFFSIGQGGSPSRVLSYSSDIIENEATFLLANASFAEKHPDIVKELVAGVAEAGEWAKGNLDQVTKSLATATGIEESVLTIVNQNASYDVVSLTDEILDSQQETADRLFKLGIVPQQVNIRDIVWRN